MSKLIQDISGLRSLLAVMPAAYWIMLLASIVWADTDMPRSVAAYNETVFLPLVPMICVLFFQRELGGSSMEMYATYPVSISLTVLRKYLLSIATMVVLHFCVFQAYVWKFGTIQGTVWSYWTDTARQGQIHWFELAAQSFPVLLSVSAFVVLWMIGVKKLYAGMAAGFGLWMAEMLSNGSLFQGAVLFTGHLQGVSFTFNRMLHLAAALLLLLAAMRLSERRDRWIATVEQE
ncbi:MULTISPECIES: hypothetical protein [unclassified Paenibacillus]|uniref:hypothetical protein n=1 Tax=unclassified Paenibacillus TaxID=185978 RepID=UPI001AE9AC12|nr:MULTISPECIES: hypothetical protein [unclassified Paenibacillus]MBP1154670.1 hypothetical protein [Paenibacillus sp. PvP091]MBP1169946.1 hypothetical protein [Paenibacillus sp. PvR098]MBP2440974.1 hypothetical protein [Paenibacillus sp. PvP052]